MTEPTKPTTLAFIDCETTGLRPDLGHGIWELAVIIRDTDGGETEYLWQIRPSLDGADPRSLEAGRFSTRFEVPDGCDALHHPGGGQPPFKMTAACAARDIRDVLHDVYLVGAVPGFDAAMLAGLLRGHGLEPAWRYRLVCVENLVAGLLGHPVPKGLRHAATAVGVEVDESARHTAMGDARLARGVYDVVTCRCEVHTEQRDEAILKGAGDSGVIVRRADLVAYLNRGTGDLYEEAAALNRLLAAAGIED